MGNNPVAWRTSLPHDRSEVEGFGTSHCRRLWYATLPLAIKISDSPHPTIAHKPSFLLKIRTSNVSEVVSHVSGRYDAWE